MNKQPTLSINLLKKRGTPSLDVLIHWAITGGRFLVILTETIALAAFLYRFSLDRQIIDLNDKIRAKERIVEAFADQETTYRVLQERMLQIKILSQNVSFMPDLFTKVAQLAQKNNLSIKSASLTDRSLHIEISAINVNNLKAFVTELQELKELQNISIDRIENRSAVAQIAAVLTANVVSPRQVVPGLASPSQGGKQ